MTGLPALIRSLEPVEGGWRGHVPDGWLQGRTAYGGFSTALALHAAKASDDDLPPLRSATVSFIGPLAGEVVIRARRLRRGRNAAFVQADVESAAGLGLRAVFVFMRDQESRIDHAAGAAPARGVVPLAPPVAAPRPRRGPSARLCEARTRRPRLFRLRPTGRPELHHQLRLCRPP